MTDVSAPILVTGATGTTGGAVLAALLDQGAHVRAVTRSPGKARELERASGVEAVVADLDDATALPFVLDGVRAVYVVNAGGPEIADREGAVAEAAVAAGVPHLVKLSAIGAGPDAPMEFGRIHGAAEAAVVASGIATTMIRPNGFMQNTLAWAAQIPSGTVYAPVADARWSIVDARDIGAVAAAALLVPDTHAGNTYTLTGPAPMSSREELAIVAEVTGREVTMQEVSVAQAIETVTPFTGEATAKRLGELWEFYATGGAEGLSGDVETVTGRPPRDFRTFAADHAAAFSA